MKQTILVIVCIILLGATAYIWYTYQKPSKNEEKEEVVDFEASLIQLRLLKTLQLDTSVLRDPFFRSLELPREISTTTQIKTGRINPFISF